MNLKTHRRSRLARRTAAAAAALLLGGGGLVAANVYASAGSPSHNRGETQDGAADQPTMSTVECPEVSDELPEMPGSARREVDRNLALLDSQVADAYQRLRSSQSAIDNDPDFVDNAILGPLKDKRTATINRIVTAIDRSADRPQGLDSLAECSLRENVAAPAEDDGQAGGDGRRQQVGGPAAEDFVDITQVRPNVSRPQNRRGASTGTFITECGKNENGVFNSDNLIAAPGVSNGAHHVHDYVGNQDSNAFASDRDLARANTSCANQEDQSSYYWPVLRLQNGQNERDANQAGGGKDGNIGPIQTPATVDLTFEGNPRSKVVAMPRFLRIITGDAKAFTNGTDNANASWSCTGFEDRQLTDKYPICPQGSQLVRTFRFQSCWDGQNTDSANHRTHVDFANDDGSCDNGFQPIPQMVQRITYDLPPGPKFAVDSFPEQLHKPVTDHSDFINVMSERLMQKAVNCINQGRTCKN
ncbi:DUF1996 domain-containing protein [Streptomyces gobiensis]|uniref:DUF1996 domain-containing protein n=1 Tax=Streptomyces gobiensis TaxID=2875706 RepID=UPI001E468327|nr:DUF1996 domain-containing protein [Streptomyces gobiensis]UGY92145.1 DUF1996 domain-containing protein [Streptomyces gobiensis]